VKQVERERERHICRRYSWICLQMHTCTSVSSY